MIDTHVHLDDARYSDADRKELLENLERDGLTAVVNAACDLETMRAGARLADGFDRVFFTVGCHPHDAKSFDGAFEREIVRLAQNPKAVAMGEIGLDYHYDLSDREIQKKVFSRQLSLAKELGLPVVVHTRDAWRDTLEILEKQGSFPTDCCCIAFRAARKFAKFCPTNTTRISHSAAQSRSKISAARRSCGRSGRIGCCAKRIVPILRPSRFGAKSIVPLLSDTLLKKSPFSEVFLSRRRKTSPKGTPCVFSV